jgi:hypothetical protein
MRAKDILRDVCSRMSTSPLSGIAYLNMLGSAIEYERRRKKGYRCNTLFFLTYKYNPCWKQHIHKQAYTYTMKILNIKSDRNTDKL